MRPDDVPGGNTGELCRHNEILIFQGQELAAHRPRHTGPVDEGENDHFDDHSEDGQKIVHNVHTGTEVSFDNVRLSREFFETDEFIRYLKIEYAVFLKLNENRSKALFINGIKLDYNDIIAEFDTKAIGIEDDNDNYKLYSFDLIFIRWKEKTKENYCIYYLNEDGIERYEETTKLNKKDTRYLSSSYKAIADLERVGDYAQNLSAYAKNLEGNAFDETISTEIERTRNLINKLFLVIIDLYKEDKHKVNKEIKDLRDSILSLSNLMVKKYIKRLNDNELTPISSGEYLKICNDTKRVSEHLINLIDTDYVLNH